MFAVDDIRDTVDRLRTHGAELLGDIAQYEDVFLLCYLHGPERHHCRLWPNSSLTQPTQYRRGAGERA